MCRWELHESGSYSVVKGEGVKWSADRATAWRLLDGEQDGQCSLEEAAIISSRVGKGMPSSTPRSYTPGAGIQELPEFAADTTGTCIKP